VVDDGIAIASNDKRGQALAEFEFGSVLLRLAE